MPLSEDDESKLGYGSIVYADFYNSSLTNSAGPHYAIVLDGDEEVRAQRIKPRPKVFVVVTSTNTQVHPRETQFPVFPRWGLKGFIQCRWLENLELAAIQKLWSTKAIPPEMDKLVKFIRSLPAPKT